MVNENNIQNNNIVIGGAEQRQKLVDNINTVIQLRETIASANESIKNVIANSYDALS